MAGIIGEIGEFSEGKETFTCYLERLEQFFIANAIKQDRAVSVFLTLTVIGPKSYTLLKSMVSPDKVSEKSLEELKKILRNHYSPQPLIIAERYKFHKREQKSGESVNEYVVELKRLASTCQFGTFLNDALRDRLVCGMLNTQSQKKLLAEKELTLVRAVQLAVAYEMANKQAQEFQPRSIVDSTGASVKRVETTKKPYRKQGTTPRKHNDGAKSTAAAGTTTNKDSCCYRCLEQHTPRECPYIKATCYYCQKVGHIAKACRKKQAKQAKGSNRNSVKQIQDGDDSSDDGDYVVYTISSVCSPKQGIILMVDLAGSQVQMELDTGAAVSIVSEKTYHTQLSSWPLESASVKLKTYGGEPIQVLGKLTLPVKYENQSHNLPLYVVVGDKPALFGRDWLAKMQIDWKRIFRVQQTAYPSPDTGTQGTPAKDITGTKEQYATVFSDKGGPIKEFAAHIYVAEIANPVFCKARPVPYSLKAKVEQELQRLQDEGIITKVDRSDWASPIVPVPKPDGSLRLCGDYKVSVNKLLDTKQYTLPNAGDLFATLEGGKVFSKIDLSHAYLQLELKAESRKYLTINTHKGLFEYNN